MALAGLFAGPASAAGHGSAGYGYKPDCRDPHLLCPEVENPRAAFGPGYVGHDEPSLLFYSNVPGSGNRMQYTITLPKDPPPDQVPGRSYSFQLSPASWVGMAICDNFSYPLVRSDCKPDSDTNITSLDRHPGVGFMELQLYSPGWVQQFNGLSCTATQWCSAMLLFGFSQQPTTGKNMNLSCQAKLLGGKEYTNFAYLTHSGRPQGPPDPLHFSVPDSGVPKPSKVLLMNGGDTIRVTLHDTPEGLQVIEQDLTNGQTGSMTASAANGFGHPVFAPDGDSCKVVPYNFHPIYSTTSPKTRVNWAAHSYNIAFSGEIGHFDWCSQVEAKSFNCLGQEGPPGIDQEPADADDHVPFASGCFEGSFALLFKVSGCQGSNAPGFDGTAYQPDWPDGNTNLHPTAMFFSSPHTGADYNVSYAHAAFEIDTPRIERDDFLGHCNSITGVGCTRIPPTDEGQPATFYPFFTANAMGGGCAWALGNDIPGVTTSDFGQTSQYGAIQANPYLIPGGHGSVVHRIQVYHKTLDNNPCP